MKLKIIGCIGWASYVRVVLLLSFLLLTGCTISPPPQTESRDYRARVETQIEGGIRVSAVILSPQETVESFAIPLAKKRVQPVWLEIENTEDKEFYLMLLSIDPDYFSPSEVAWMFRSYGESNLEDEESLEEKGSLDDKIDMFVNKHIPVVVPPHSTVSGYVYTNLDPGGKAFAVELFGKQDARSFEFVQLVPGFKADFMRVDFDQLYPPNELQDLDLEGLRQYLETLPCCVLGGDRETAGDPLNLVIVGDGPHVLATLVRRGWDFTETMRGATMWRTATSSVFGSKYRTSPVSPLYLFDRPQDIALQKARSTVDERNHLRLWRTPVTLDGQNVFVGQISRDIGVKLSSKTFVTHKIDPIVDEARLYITLDMVASQTLRAVGYVKGVGYSDRKSPRFNYTKDPFYTDGLRVVLILGEERRSLDSIEYLPWERATGRKQNKEDIK
jgi:hypothetical protein